MTTNNGQMGRVCDKSDGLGEHQSNFIERIFSNKTPLHFSWNIIVSTQLPAFIMS